MPTPTIRVSQLPDIGTPASDNLLLVSILSATVTITAGTISAQASDNSFNDSANGFGAFAVDDQIHVTGFTGDVANNLYSGTVTAATLGKLTIGGTDGDVIVDDAAGESVTITKWESVRMTLSELAAYVAAAPGAGTVTSVALSAPAEFSVSGSPVTGSGTLTFTKANQSANLVYAGPSSGGAAPPTFRALASDDLPANARTQSIIVACSDETTALTTGAAKVTFRMPYAFTLSAVRASVTTAPTGAAIQVGINEAGSSILSTDITIDATEKTSATAATPPVISDTALADDAEITIDIDAVGTTIAGAGLKVTLIGART